MSEDITVSTDITVEVKCNECNQDLIWSLEQDAYGNINIFVDACDHEDPYRTSPRR